MKRIFAFLIVILLISPFCIQTPALTIQTVRVGLVSQKSNSISIKNKALSLGQELTIQTPNGVTATGSDDYYVALSQTFTDYNQALNNAHSQPYKNASVAYIDKSKWGVYIGGFKNDSEARSFATNVGGNIVSVNKTRVLLSDNASLSILIEKPLQIAAVNENILLGSNTYRGAIELNRESAIIPVNVLSVEEYLYSVVPTEMPSHWHIEALKAQAVASRNFTLTVESHNGQAYDLCDGSHCQNYSGVKWETDATTKAVNETAGVMAYFNNTIINAVYFSSSGGVTESSENVWVNTIPYLRGVVDTFEKETRNWSRTFTLSDIKNALASKGVNIGDVVGLSITSISPSNRVDELTVKGTNGNKAFHKEEIRTLFSSLPGGTLESRNFTFGDKSSLSDLALGNNNITLLTYIPPTAPTSEKLYAISSTGQIVEVNATVNVMGSTKTVMLELGNGNKAPEQPVMPDQTPTPLPAPIPTPTPTPQLPNPVPPNVPTIPSVSANAPRALDISMIAQNLLNTSGQTITIKGKGYGHGVGMSQFGAKGMAEAGFNYKQILEYYFTGVNVR